MSKNLTIKDLDYSLSYEEKCKVVEAFAEDYYALYQQNPPTDILEILSDYLLADIFAVKSRTKAITDEYPILSHQQFKRREKREYRVSDEDALSYLKCFKKYPRKGSKKYE